MCVGVIGVGGLGHIAIQFAKAMGCTVTAISTGESKRDEAAVHTRTHTHTYVHIGISSLLSFPHVCPEPVLVKSSFLSINDYKDG
eukprot:COSAG06_NODE_1623_length_8895_cov_86.951683_7_plen_85_part_00